MLLPFARIIFRSGRKLGDNAGKLRYFGILLGNQRGIVPVFVTLLRLQGFKLFLRLCQTGRSIPQQTAKESGCFRFFGFLSLVPVFGFVLKIVFEGRFKVRKEFFGKTVIFQFCHFLDRDRVFILYLAPFRQAQQGQNMSGKALKFHIYKILKLILYVIHLIYFSDGGLCQHPLYSVFQRTELVDITVCHGYVTGEYLSPEKGKFRIVGNT